MNRLVLVAALLLLAPITAQPPARPKAVEELDAKMLGDVVKIVRTDYDPTGKVVWLVEAKGPNPFPPLVARCFDVDDVEYAAPPVDFQHGARATGERTRATIVLPGGPATWSNIKRIVIAVPVSAR
jgi:hypothetical protein